MNELERLFFHDDPAKRQKWFDLFRDPVWKPRYNYPLNDMREHAMSQLRKVAQSGIVSVTDFFSDPTNIFTAHENIGTVSPSTCTKFTVHYNLFGGTIAALHTDRHKFLFPLIDKLDITGCFCLTELGYGNNAVQM
jgi:acyl-CoA oxidase